MKFREFLNLQEETTAADIATVDTKIGLSRRQKPCKKHNIINCKECIKEGEKENE